jgi:hypothetical protein
MNTIVVRVNSPKKIEEALNRLEQLDHEILSISLVGNLLIVVDGGDTPPSEDFFLLLEDGNYLLLENGDRIII